MAFTFLAAARGNRPAALLAPAIILCLTHCSTVSPAPRTNLIVADEQGRPHEPAPGYPPMTLSQYDKYLDAMFADFEEYCSHTPKPCKLLLFFHGGLNSHEDSICRASSWQAKIRTAGYYPIFVSWNSSFSTAWWDHVAHVHQGVWTGSKWVFASPYIIAKDEVRSIAEAPLEWMAELRHTCR